MRNLTLILTALSLITLTACPNPPTGDTYVTYEGDVYEGDTVNNYGDDDSAENTPADDDDSAAIEEPEPTRLEINFSTAWSSLGPTQIFPGELANFGTYVFRLTGEPGAEISIRAKGIRIVTKDDSSDAFTPWMNSSATEISLEDHLETCVLRNQPTGMVYQGPSNPSDASSAISFDEDFPMEVEEDGETFLALQLSCATTEVEPADEESGFAAQWEPSSFDVVDENGAPVDWSIWNDNGSWANPTVQVWIQRTVAEASSFITLSRSVSSPGGGATPGLQSVLRFHVCTDAGYDAEITSIKFDMTSTDNAGSGWNSCGILGQNVAINLVNLNAPTTPIELYEWRTTTSNANCEFATEDSKVGYVYMELDEVIPAGTCSTYELLVNAVYASAPADDTIRVDIVDEEWLVWFDQNGNGHDGSDASGLPVQGLTLQF